MQVQIIIINTQHVTKLLVGDDEANDDDNRPIGGTRKVEEAIQRYCTV